MLDIDEIKNAVEQLENQPITFDTCQKLANLYAILEHADKQSSHDADSEDIILPHYSKYCELKGKYQMRELGSVPVLDSLAALCFDFEKLILTLYSTTDMEDERIIITESLTNLLKTINARK